MTTQATWHEHVVGDLLTFSAPGPLKSADAQGMDSAVGEWHGDGLVVRTDYGLFVDQLNRYQGRSHLQQFEESIDQVPARIVSFDQPDGSHFTAVHFPAVPSRGPAPRSSRSSSSAPAQKPAPTRFGSSGASGSAGETR